MATKTGIGRISTRKTKEAVVSEVRLGTLSGQDTSFNVIKHAITKQFELMKQHPLFRVDLSPSTGDAQLPPDMRKAATGDVLWKAYLAAFPPGTDPLYKERTDHDCQCCKAFIRQMGGVVAIVDGYAVSLWNFEPTGTFYDVVAAAMDQLVRTAAIDNIFLHTEKSVGTEKSFQQITSEKEAIEGVRVWDHFHLRLPDSVVVKKDLIGPKLSEAQSTFDVLKRSLEEITTEAIDTVLELIAQNSIYRGEEQKFAVSEFRKVKREYGVENPDRPTGRDVGNAVLKAADKMYGMLGSRDAELDRARDMFIWSQAVKLPASVGRIRSTAVGTLLQDLSPSWHDASKPCNDALCMQRDTLHAHEPLGIDEAVKSFEAKVAPANYKRPTALVTKAMIEKARKTVEELGLTSALERRYAVMEDITVNNVLFADRSVKVLSGGRGGGKTASAAFGAPYGKAPQFTGDDVFSALGAAIPEKPKSFDKVEEVSIEKFLSDVLPKAKSLEVLFENRHAGNLVSLVAPVDPGASKLFKWPNGFSWSYVGDFADSIKERVKKAGGSVTGDLCCRLAWDYEDDLDFHMYEPGSYVSSVYDAGSNHIYYGNVRRLSASGGMLDLDANGCDGMKAEPVENIFYADQNKMAEGTYTLKVHNYSRRSTGVGFTAEVEFGGQTHSFVYDKVVASGAYVEIAEIAFTRKDVFKIIKSLPSTTVSKQVWNLPTQTFCKVNAVMLSPNYWTCLRCDGSGDGPVHPHNGDILDCEGCGGKGSVGIGNKHWFFMLEGCANDGTARGFYNEFLKPELEPHRKTLEMVGAKMRTDESDRQLSGLGFSSTKRDSITVRVTGATTRVLKVLI